MAVLNMDRAVDHFIGQNKAGIGKDGLCHVSGFRNGLKEE
jgi:hypothetical protein